MTTIIRSEAELATLGADDSAILVLNGYAVPYNSRVQKEACAIADLAVVRGWTKGDVTPKTRRLQRFRSLFRAREA